METAPDERHRVAEALARIIYEHTKGTLFLGPPQWARMLKAADYALSLRGSPEPPSPPEVLWITGGVKIGIYARCPMIQGLFGWSLWEHRRRFYPWLPNEYPRPTKRLEWPDERE